MLKSYSLCGIILRQTISFKKPDAADFLRTGLGLLNNLTPCRVKMAVRLVEISGKLQNSHILFFTHNVLKDADMNPPLTLIANFGRLDGTGVFGPDHYLLSPGWVGEHVKRGKRKSYLNRCQAPG